MRFFFDRNVSPHLARMLAAYAARDGHEIRALDDDPRFQKTTPDVEWLATLGSDDPSWIVICGDSAILTNAAERAALEEANLTFFCLTKSWMKMTFGDQAWRLVKEWHKIVAKAQSVKDKPRIFKIHWGRSVTIDDFGVTRTKNRQKK